MCCDPGCSGARHHAQNCETTPGLEGRRNTKSAQLRSQDSTASTTMWSLASAVGGLQCCRGCCDPHWCLQIGSRADSSCCWSWSCTHTHTHPAVKTSCRRLCSDRVGCRHSELGWGSNRAICYYKIYWRVFNIVNLCYTVHYLIQFMSFQDKLEGKVNNVWENNFE